MELGLAEGVQLLYSGVAGGAASVHQSPSAAAAGVLSNLGLDSPGVPSSLPTTGTTTEDRSHVWKDVAELPEPEFPPTISARQLQLSEWLDRVAQVSLVGTCVLDTLTALGVSLEPGNNEFWSAAETQAVALPATALLLPFDDLVRQRGMHPCAVLGCALRAFGPRTSAVSGNTQQRFNDLTKPRSSNLRGLRWEPKLGYNGKATQFTYAIKAGEVALPDDMELAHEVVAVVFDPATQSLRGRRITGTYEDSLGIRILCRARLAGINQIKNNWTAGGAEDETTYCTAVCVAREEPLPVSLLSHAFVSDREFVALTTHHFVFTDPKRSMFNTAVFPIPMFSASVAEVLVDVPLFCCSLWMVAMLMMVHNRAVGYDEDDQLQFHSVWDLVQRRGLTPSRTPSKPMAPLKRWDALEKTEDMAALAHWLAVKEAMEAGDGFWMLNSQYSPFTDIVRGEGFRIGLCDSDGNATITSVPLDERGNSAQDRVPADPCLTPRPKFGSSRQRGTPKRTPKGDIKTPSESKPRPRSRQVRTGVEDAPPAVSDSGSEIEDDAEASDSASETEDDATRSPRTRARRATEIRTRDPFPYAEVAIAAPSDEAPTPQAELTGALGEFYRERAWVASEEAWSQNQSVVAHERVTKPGYIGAPLESKWHDLVRAPRAVQMRTLTSRPTENLTAFRNEFNNMRQRNPGLTTPGACLDNISYVLDLLCNPTAHPAAAGAQMRTAYNTTSMLWRNCRPVRGVTSVYRNGECTKWEIVMDGAQPLDRELTAVVIEHVDAYYAADCETNETPDQQRRRDAYYGNEMPIVLAFEVVSEIKNGSGPYGTVAPGTHIFVPVSMYTQAMHDVMLDTSTDMLPEFASMVVQDCTYGSPQEATEHSAIRVVPASDPAKGMAAVTQRDIRGFDADRWLVPLRDLNTLFTHHRIGLDSDVLCEHFTERPLTEYPHDQLLELGDEVITAALADFHANDWSIRGIEDQLCGGCVARALYFIDRIICASYVATFGGELCFQNTCGGVPPQSLQVSRGAIHLEQDEDWQYETSITSPSYSIYALLPKKLRICNDAQGTPLADVGERTVYTITTLAQADLVVSGTNGSLAYAVNHWETPDERRNAHRDTAMGQWLRETRDAINANPSAWDDEHIVREVSHNYETFDGEGDIKSRTCSQSPELIDPQSIRIRKGTNSDLAARSGIDRLSTFDLSAPGLFANRDIPAGTMIEFVYQDNLYYHTPIDQETAVDYLRACLNERVSATSVGNPFDCLMDTGDMGFPSF